MTTTLEDLGYNDYFRQQFTESFAAPLEPARIIEAHPERYRVRTSDTTRNADITGSLRFRLEEAEDRPATGDWEALAASGKDYGVIHEILPRQSVLCRRAVSGRAEKQVIAANIDVALIVQAVEHDFNLNRLDRYVAVAHGARIRPMVLLSKADLVSPTELTELLARIHQRHPDIEVVGGSSLEANGLDALIERLAAGLTYCVLGSSGVGKSTLVNALAGEELLATRELSSWNQRGQHTTSHRALFVLPCGAILIDTPGMRELGLPDGGEALKKAFGQIHALAQTCRFADCGHESEPGCAVREALDQGTLDEEQFANYRKLQRESAHFEASIAERHRKARNQGKLYKRIKRETRDRYS
jgi:ribosome biogenesis GTPase